MAIKCPKCQFENTLDSDYCKECGAKLVSSEEIPIHTKTLQTPMRGAIKDVDVGEIIGEKYKLIEELGSGGMGVVYQAEQLKPIKRSVAIKIIKLGMDTKEVVARFETEKQALAVMKHPNISKVIDAGATEKGRPYFVMELVSGIPITNYCDKHELSTKERLEMFIPVCEAVQHAHQKGVIHRDLKPSNVLVEIQDGKPIPKIIDFGIARATEHRLTERTIFTERGQLIGTPEYMSPEQAEMSGLDVDTRTDIYSLGVMLYELLVGSLPFDSKKLRSAGFSEIQRIIREEEPPRASTRLSGLGDTRRLIAERRRTEAATLYKQLKGDLDWITMKAMEKDRTRRYSTATELAVDIERHLGNEPIQASPPSTIYHFKKYIMRHKVGVVATAFLMLAILAGIAGTSLGLIQAKQAEKVANIEVTKTKAINEFLQEMLGSADPRLGEGRDVTVLEVLDAAVEKIEESFQKEPEIEAAVRHTIGITYSNLGYIEQSAEMLRSALAIRKETLGSHHPDTVLSMVNFAYQELMRGHNEEAEILIREAAAISEDFKGKELEVRAEALNIFGIILGSKGDLESAMQLHRESYEIHRIIYGSEDPRTLTILHNIAYLAHISGDYDEAETVFREVLAAYRKVLGEEHTDVAMTMTNLANVLHDKGNYKEAEKLHRDAIQIAIKVDGDSHPSMLFKWLGLARTVSAQGNCEEGVRIFESALEIEKLNPLRELYAAKTQSQFGALLAGFQCYSHAEMQLLDALNIQMIHLGKNDEQTQLTIHHLIRLYEAWDKPEKAAEYRALLKDSEIKK
jgi:serine/threonine protein kinase